MKSFWIFLVLISSVNCDNLIYARIQQRAVASHLSNAVFDIIKSFYSAQGPNFHIIKCVEASYNNELNEIITNILRQVAKSNVTTVIEDCKQLTTITGRKRFSVITFIDSIDNFMIFFRNFTSTTFKFRRFFTIVAVEKITIVEMEIIFSYIWKILITNVNIITNNHEAVDLFTFKPFNGVKCGDTTPVKINSFNSSALRWKQKVFHPKKTRNLQKCTIKIGCAVG